MNFDKVEHIDQGRKKGTEGVIIVDIIYMCLPTKSRVAAYSPRRKSTFYMQITQFHSIVSADN